MYVHAMLAFLLIALSGSALPQKIVNVELSAPSNNPTTISPYIYGLGTYMRDDRREDNTWALNPGHFRFGGNMADRFNWKENAWNSGADWYFTNFASRHKNMVDSFLADNDKHDVPSSVALPMLGWVAKDSSSGSFPEAVYGKQRDVKNGMGNGQRPDGSPLKADPTRANIKIGDDWIKEWVTHLKTEFGSHPHQYIIGNEPMLWHITHRDVHPDPATYDEVLAKYIATASVVRKTDPAAVIIGPALWGWLATQQSAFDERGTWSNFRKFSDRDRHGGKPFLDWFLEEIVKEEKRRGVSLIDVLDVHYYPEGEKLRNRRPSSDESRRARIEATRSLWDKTWTDDSWIKERIRLIPYLKELAARHKPGLKVAIGEYNFRAEEDISGAIVQAEVLGIFGVEGLWSADYWTIPPADSSPAFAFKLFRNYDGKQSSFGSQRIENSVGIQPERSVFSAWDPSTKKLTILLSNKSLWQVQTFEIKGGAIAPGIKSVRQFRYSVGNPKGIVETKLEAGKPLRAELPPLSLVMLEISL